MQFSAESVVLSVQDVRFRVSASNLGFSVSHVLLKRAVIRAVLCLQFPKISLQQLSDIFVSMLDASNGSSENPIELDDPLEVFQEFREMVFTSVCQIFPDVESFQLS